MTIKPKIAAITRENLTQWRVASLARERDGENTNVASEPDLLKSRRAVIADKADCSDVWVFGYGSLICNPIIDHDQRILARVYGFHRRFCLWTKIGRGSPECPGLVLSLDRGGSCLGVAYRLRAETAIAELDLLWRREMLTLAYDARWLKLSTPDGEKQALAFVANRQIPAYAPPMSFEATVDVVARARGFNGYCHDYLYDTLDGFRACGIRDRYMEKLASAVRERLASNQ
jgi:cation transport protein ChaC